MLYPSASAIISSGISSPCPTPGCARQVKAPPELGMGCHAASHATKTGVMFVNRKEQKVLILLRRNGWTEEALQNLVDLEKDEAVKKKMKKVTKDLHRFNVSSAPGTPTKFHQLSYDADLPRRSNNADQDVSLQPLAQPLLANEPYRGMSDVDMSDDDL
ncbi:hypothetical protein P43SY_009956 [Pythium insidiosum]|uniref:Uncharacterized protein n=1 Tax=Pythium insidiosum TaxID=114742 RepID=A0AAD5MBK1_PYTIN|nr:hypothetical protein ATCC90586_002763 [Pythium insidiosum]KAJ0401772.1 hypothetical protein P43SY_009956 [Pythium insidiosum]